MRQIQIERECTDLDIDEETETMLVPARMEVCPECEGHGSVLTQGLRGEVIDFSDWDDDEREGYFNGRYDVMCPCCKGANVIPVPDEESMNAEQLAFWRDSQRWQDEIERSARETAAYSRAERMMGA